MRKHVVGFSTGLENNFVFYTKSMHLKYIFIFLFQTYKKNLNVSFQDRSILERSYDMAKKEAELSK